MWFSAPPGYAVCGACVADAALACFIEEHADEPECSFCGVTGTANIATDATAVLEYMSRCLRREWARPIDEYLYDRESLTGYAGDPPRDLQEVLEPEYPMFKNEDFETFVYDAFSETEWCPRDFAALNEEEALRYGWSDLATTVKHRQRFLFLLDSNDKADEGPGAEIRRGPELLDALADLIRQHGLVRNLEPTTALYRCRLHGTRKRYTAAKDLGAPPDENASQSRMSPAGISMLYVADNPDTAFAETFDAKRTRTKGATPRRST
jgi:HEPN/RES N-terminal domain 1/RES domain